MITLLATAILAAVGVAAGAVRHVPAGQVHSLYRRGKPLRLLQPGTHWVMPGLDRVGHRIDLGGQVLSFENDQADSQEVRGKVYWQVLEPERADAVIEQAAQMIRTGALSALRAESADVPVDRRDLGSRLKQALNGSLRERGMMVTRVDLEIA